MGKNLIIIIVIALFVGLVASSVTVVFALKSSPNSNTKHLLNVKPYIDSIRDFITNLSPLVNERPVPINSTNTNSTSTSEVNKR